ncbi:MAG: Crp/Fnr family transcriptional regulator [Burkholderiales bacterium]
MKAASIEALPEALLQQVAQQAVLRTFQRNAIIVTEGDESDSLYVLVSGRAKVFVSDADGKEVQLNQIGPGEYFGEVTLDGGLRSASVMALEDCRCAVLRRAEMAGVMARYPDFALHIIRKLAHRVRSLTDSVRDLAFIDVYGRVARLLLELAEEIDGRIVIDQRMTQKDIAARIGASREMVSRIFSDLTEGGYVRKEEGRIVVLRKPPARW